MIIEVPALPACLLMCLVAGKAALGLDRFAEAERYADRAATVAAALSSHADAAALKFRAHCEEFRGRIYSQSGRTTEAIAQWESALAYFEVQSPVSLLIVVDILIAISTEYMAAEQQSMQAAAVRRARVLCDTLPRSSLEYADCWSKFFSCECNFYLSSGRRAEALRSLQASYEMIVESDGASSIRAAAALSAIGLLRSQMGDAQGALLDLSKARHFLSAWVVPTVLTMQLS